MNGKQRKEQGIERVSENSGGLVDALVNYAVAHAQNTSRVTADDMRDICESLGVEIHHPNVMGAVFNTARRRGLLRPIGYTESLAYSRHGGAIRVWAAA